MENANIQILSLKLAMGINFFYIQKDFGNNSQGPIWSINVQTRPAMKVERFALAAQISF